MTTTDLTGLTRADLLALTVKLGAELDAVRSQLAEARAVRAAGGAYADRFWYTETASKERELGRELQRVYVQIGRLRQEQHVVAKPRPREFYRAFFERVRETLPRKQFLGLCDATDQYLETTK